jgi:hypothetical protein
VTLIELVIADHAIVTDLLPTNDIKVPGTSGAPSANPVAVVSAPLPYVFSPITDTVYSVPLISPVIEQLLAAVAVDVQVPPPGVAVAV